MSASIAGLGQARPFTLHRPSTRPRLVSSVRCSAKSGAPSRHFVAGTSSLAAVLASVPKAWADVLEIPSDLKYPGLEVPELPNLPTDASGVTQFISDYPLLLPAAAGLVLVPLLISQLNGGGGKVQGVSGARALELLGTDDAVIFVDIRSKESARESGDPDLRSVKKNITRLPYSKVVKGESVLDDAFGDKFSKLRAITEDTTVILLDSDGSEAPAAARLLSGLVGRVFYVAGGSDGPRGWKASELPWKAPGKLSFNLGSLKNFGSNIDSFAEDFKSAPTASKALLGLGAIVGGALLFFQEIDTALEVAGIFAAGQFAIRRLLFAEDRAQTTTEIKKLVDEKIAVKEVPKDLKKLATKVLEAEQAAEGKVAKRAKGAAQDIKSKAADVKAEVNSAAGSLYKEAKSAAGAVDKEVKAAANEVDKNVDKAKDAANDVAGTTEKKIDAARDTVDLNGAGAPSASSSPKEEARSWIENWRNESGGQKKRKAFFD